MTIKEQVFKILEEVLPSATVTDDSVIVLNCSALDEDYQRELIMQLEEKFGIDILDKDAENLYTIKDIVKYIEKKTKK